MKRLLILPFLVLSFVSFAQSEKTLLDFNDEKISETEFKRVYLKNNSGEIVSKSTVDEYLDLYINFKLKVKEALSLGMDKDPSFVSELKGYRSQLAQPYLSENNMLEALKKEAYERLKWEIKASHILVNCGPKESPADTLIAYKKILEYRKMALSKGFDKVAKEYSDDPSAKENGGELGYFTAFYMVYPFESAAYETKVGEISMPIRTRFGYHLVKVEDKRPANGSITVAHILISTDPELASSDDAEAKAKEVYNLIQEDIPFEELAKQFSDDKRTADQGGLLPAFSVGRMIKEFEDAAFALEKNGDVSKPIKSKYGWHIIKRIEKEELGTYESLSKELESKVKKDSRSNLTEGAALKKIQKTYGFTENIKERNDFYKLIDTSYFGSNWDKKRFSKLNKVMFEIGDRKVNQTDFSNYLNEIQTNKSPIDAQIFINDAYTTFKKNQIMAFKDSKLESEYPEFKALIQEYHDGILLFNLTDKLVWSKAVEDTTGLEAFYEQHKENYKWGKRADAVIFSAANEKIANETKKLLKAGKDLEEVINEINKTSQLNLKKESKKYEKGENEMLDQVEWKKGFSKNIDNQGRVSFVWIVEVLEPTYKTLEDSKGIITSDYQEYLEQEWIKALRAKYKYTFNQEVLEQLKKELN
ncbi:MAG: peptidylprolyl isomerase [Flavobacteriales bacterium]|nr:peptidylprolyl isomerase [Flavobacteriales bacterium]